MTENRDHPKSLDNVLNHQASELGHIYQKLQQLQLLQGKLDQCLPDTFKPYCRVANYREGCLVIGVSSAAWATQLRYAIPDLLQLLRTQAGLYDLCSISTYIDPYLHQPLLKEKDNKKITKEKLTNYGEKMLQELCEYLHKDKL